MKQMKPTLEEAKHWYFRRRQAEKETLEQAKY